MHNCTNRCLGCFDQALQLSDDDSLADVWYNVSQVGAAASCVLCMLCCACCMLCCAC